MRLKLVGLFSLMNFINVIINLIALNVKYVVINEDKHIDLKINSPRSLTYKALGYEPIKKVLDKYLKVWYNISIITPCS